MKKLLKGAISTLVIGLMSLQLFGMNVLANEIPTIKIPVKISVTGDYPSKDEVFEVVLTAKEDFCPMPEGSADGTFVLEVSGGSSAKFPEISYPDRGIYEYTIHQEDGNYSRGSYDEHTYNMKVFVTNAEQGGLESTAILYIDDVNTKFAEVEFVNYYKDKKVNPTQPTTPPSPTEPTPSGELPTDPIRDIVEEEINPSGVLGAFDEFGNSVGVLPATGTLWWVVPILVLGGVALMVIGRRRGHENEE